MSQEFMLFSARFKKSLTSAMNSFIKTLIITAFIGLFALIGFAQAQVAAPQPEPPTEAEAAYVSELAGIARSITADEKGSVELALPGGYTYVREAVEPDTEPTIPSSRSIGPKSSVVWIMTGFKATDYIQGYPYRWVYAAQATYESSDGQIVRKTYRDSAVLYLLPATINILAQFMNFPLPSDPIGGMISVITGYQLGHKFDQWYEQDGNLLQYWEIMAWGIHGNVITGMDDYYWQAVAMNSKIDGGRPKA